MNDDLNFEIPPVEKDKIVKVMAIFSTLLALSIFLLAEIHEALILIIIFSAQILLFSYMMILSIWIIIDRSPFLKISQKGIRFHNTISTKFLYWQCINSISYTTTQKLTKGGVINSRNYLIGIKFYNFSYTSIFPRKKITFSCDPMSIRDEYFMRMFDIVKAQLEADRRPYAGHFS